MEKEIYKKSDELSNSSSNTICENGSNSQNYNIPLPETISIENNLPSKIIEIRDIFVGGLTADYNEEEIRNHFQKEVKSAVKIYHPTKNSKSKKKFRGFFVLRNLSKKDAKKLLKKRDRVIASQKIHLKPYFEGEELKIFKKLLQKRKLFFKGIPAFWDSLKLKKFLENFGEVEEACAIVNTTSRECRGYGYGIFFREVDASKCKQLNKLEIENEKIWVTKYEERYVFPEEFDLSLLPEETKRKLLGDKKKLEKLNKIKNKKEKKKFDKNLKKNNKKKINKNFKENNNKNSYEKINNRHHEIKNQIYENNIFFENFENSPRNFKWRSWKTQVQKPIINPYALPFFEPNVNFNNWLSEFEFENSIELKFTFSFKDLMSPYKYLFVSNNKIKLVPKEEKLKAFIALKDMPISQKLALIQNKYDRYNELYRDVGQTF